MLVLKLTLWMIPDQVRADYYMHVADCYLSIIISSRESWWIQISIQNSFQRPNHANVTASILYPAGWALKLFVKSWSLNSYSVISLYIVHIVLWECRFRHRFSQSLINGRKYQYFCFFSSSVSVLCYLHQFKQLVQLLYSKTLKMHNFLILGSWIT